MEVVFFLFLYHLPTPCSRSIILQSRVTNILVSEEPAGLHRGNFEKCGQCYKWQNTEKDRLPPGTGLFVSYRIIDGDQAP